MFNETLACNCHVSFKGKKLSMEKEKDDDDLGDVSDEDEAAEMVIQDGDDVDGLKRDKHKEKEKVCYSLLINLQVI